MDANHLSGILLEKFKRKELGHFYLLGHAEKSQLKLEQWVFDFLNSIAFVHDPQAAKINSLNHPDLLWVSPEEGKNYQVEELNEFFLFMESYPLQWSHKFVVFSHAPMLTEVLANKLLKILESPNDHITIIVLNANASPVLKTLKSRAIELCICAADRRNSIGLTWENISELLEMHPSYKLFPESLKIAIQQFCQDSSNALQFLEAIKTHKNEQKEVFNCLLEWRIQNAQSYREYNHLLQELYWFQNSDTFHNSYYERFFSLVYNQAMH